MYASHQGTYGEVTIMDASLLQAISAFLTGMVSLSVFTVGLINKSHIIAFFRDRERLMSDLTEQVARSNEYQRRVLSSESLAKDWESSSVARGAQIADLSARLREVERLQPQFDALVAWATDMLIYTVYVERQASAAGVVNDRQMPPIPAILSERIRTPH